MAEESCDVYFEAIFRFLAERLEFVLINERHEVEAAGSGE